VREKKLICPKYKAAMIAKYGHETAVKSETGPNIDQITYSEDYFLCDENKCAWWTTSIHKPHNGWCAIHGQGDTE
jgi:hypothetical protein